MYCINLIFFKWNIFIYFMGEKKIFELFYNSCEMICEI